ncbi:hypothetical protein OAJ47_00120 [bacterium]|nr:hypothetical protein [bacterium]
MKIDFDKLLKDYNSDLVTKLRGFNDEHDYLQYWVPGSDKSKSLINLIDALYESNVFSFTILILEKDKYLLDDIKSISKRIRELKTNLNKDIFEVSILLDKTKYKSFTKKEIKVNSKKIDNSVKLKKLDDRRQNYDILKDYDNNLKNHTANLDFKKNKIGKNIFFEFLNKENKLFVKINEKTKIINECWHDYKSKNNISIIVDKFCKIIVNKNIQEAAEHGTIYLEHLIRPNSINQSIKGIILPKKVGGIFFDLHKCINQIYFEIKQKYNFKDSINKEFPELSTEWLNISDEQKLTKLNNCLSEKIIPNLKLNKNDIIIYRVEHNIRIIIKISKELEEKNNADINYIIKIENIFKKYIDNRLELFITEKKDDNKLRLSNSPQKI